MYVITKELKSVALHDEPGSRYAIDGVHVKPLPGGVGALATSTDGRCLVAVRLDRDYDDATTHETVIQAKDWREACAAAGRSKPTRTARLSANGSVSVLAGAATVAVQPIIDRKFPECRAVIPGAGMDGDGFIPVASIDKSLLLKLLAAMPDTSDHNNPDTVVLYANPAHAGANRCGLVVASTVAVGVLMGVSGRAIQPIGTAVKTVIGE